MDLSSDTTKNIPQNKGGRPQKLTTYHVKAVQQLVNDGFTQEEIANFFGYSRSTVSRFINENEIKRISNNILINATSENMDIIKNQVKKYANRFRKKLVINNIKMYDQDEILSILWYTAAKCLRSYGLTNPSRTEVNGRASFKTYLTQSFENAFLDYQHEVVSAAGKREAAVAFYDLALEEVPSDESSSDETDNDGVKKVPSRGWSLLERATRAWEATSPPVKRTRSQFLCGECGTVFLSTLLVRLQYPRGFPLDDGEKIRCPFCHSHNVEKQPVGQREVLTQTYTTVESGQFFWN